jgi:hypothetical protein
MMLREADGLLIRGWRIFWMGHAGNIEFVYTLHKGLDEETIEEMRGACLKAANRYLCTGAGAREEFRKALRVFDILSDASEEGLVGEDAFVRAQVRDGELTKKGAKAMVQKPYETNEIYGAKRGHYKRAGASRGKREKPRMPLEQR